MASAAGDLEAIGLIVSRRQKVDKSRGRPPIAFELNPQAGNAIGIGLQPGRASAALVNLVSDIRSRCREVDMDTGDRRQMLAAMLQLVAQLQRDRPSRSGASASRCRGRWVTPTSASSARRRWRWNDLSVLDELGEVTGLSVFYRIDSVAGALGETLFGVAQPGQLLLSAPGLGPGRRTGDRPRRTSQFERQCHRDRPCLSCRAARRAGCGNRGCLERYVSMHSLAEGAEGVGPRRLDSIWPSG